MKNIEKCKKQRGPSPENQNYAKMSELTKLKKVIQSRAKSGRSEAEEGVGPSPNQQCESHGVKNMPLVAAAKLLSACPQIWKSEIS